MAETTARELQGSGVRPRRAAERLREAILERLGTLQRERGLTRLDAARELFGGVVMESAALENLVAGLLSGGHTLVLGPSGSGKTLLAKAIWDLFPRDVLAVADCPVQDDPWSLLDEAFARKVPPCPFCTHRHGEAGKIRPEDIPVRRLRLREGHGLARIQGSAEVFPDNLTGSVNLARLEEVGDPTSPLVLEPGKVLQAHRGMLFVDEVGKLPRGTQNVLLQALQEGIVTPAKSRETFPADIVAVATTNVRDLGAITEPLSDRLAHALLALPRSHRANRRIVDLGLGAQDDGPPVPGPYRDVAVELMTRWRTKGPGTEDLAEVASNRTLVEMLRRARGYALLAGAAQLEPEDLRRGARDAMRGRVRARSQEEFDRNQGIVEGFVEAQWQDAARAGATQYWCRFSEGELKGDRAEAARVLEAVRAAAEAAKADPEAWRTRLRQDGDAKLRRFGDFVRGEERVGKDEAAAAVPAVYRALEGLGAFAKA